MQKYAQRSKGEKLKKSTLPNNVFLVLKETKKNESLLFDLVCGVRSAKLLVSVEYEIQTRCSVSVQVERLNRTPLSTHIIISQSNSTDYTANKSKTLVIATRRDAVRQRVGKTLS